MQRFYICMSHLFTELIEIANEYLHYLIQTEHMNSNLDGGY